MNRSASTDIDHLLSRVLEHDDYAAFEKLFYINYDPLRNFSKKLVHINEVAEEVVNDFFLKIWSNRKHIVISSSAKAYLYTAVRNKSFDHLRKEKRTSWVNLEEADSMPCDYNDPQQQAELQELQLRIDQAIDVLPKQCRLIYRLSRDKGMKYQAIAKMLNLSVKTVETQMGRALKSLRKNLVNEQRGEYMDSVSKAGCARAM